MSSPSLLTSSTPPSATSVPSDGAPDHRETDDEAIARLAKLDRLEYDRVRKPEAAALGISVKTLDEQVKQVRDKNGESRPGPWSEVEPPAGDRARDSARSPVPSRGPRRASPRPPSKKDASSLRTPTMSALSASSAENQLIPARVRYVSRLCEQPQIIPRGTTGKGEFTSSTLAG